MTRESLSRKFHTAGFEQPEESRRNYGKAPGKLQKLFYDWIDGLSEKTDPSFEKQYRKATGILKYLDEEISIQDANSLLVGFEPKTEGQKVAGLFVSACYNHSPERLVVIDLDAEDIYCLGYRLGKRKVLVNNGAVGDFFSIGNYGIVINNGRTGESFGRGSDGIIVNNGSFDLRCGFLAQGPLILLKNSGPIEFSPHGIFLKPGDLKEIPELKLYLEDLCEITRNLKDEDTAKKFVEIYGTDGEKIKPEIEEILRREEF